MKPARVRSPRIDPAAEPRPSRDDGPRDATLAVPDGLCGLGRAAAEAVLAGVDGGCQSLFGRRATTGGCRAFFTPAEWRAKGWELADNAVLVIVHDGGDLRMMHKPGSVGRAVHASLRDLGLRHEMAEHVVTTIHRDD